MLAPILEGVPEESLVMSNRVERVLAFMVAAIIVLSLASLIAALIAATGSGFGRDDFAQGIWPAVTIMPLVGLPTGFVLIIVLLVVSAVRRGRASKDAGN